MSTSTTTRPRSVVTSSGDVAPTPAVDDVHAVMTALVSLVRTSRSLGRRLQEDLGASGTPLAVLKALARHDGLDRPGDLAATAGVAPSVVSRVIARLEEDGLVDRRRDATDARACHIALTDAGRVHLDHVERESAALLAPSLRGIPADDLRRLPGLLGQLEQAMVHTTERTATARSATTESSTTESN